MERKGHTAVVGCQWGDEGKGKIVHLLAGERNTDGTNKYNYVVRFNGGNNAGHTVVTEGETYKFHLLPSGVLHPDIVNVLAHGVVIDPEVLVGEIKELNERGKFTDNLIISNIAHLIMPYQKIRDGREGGKIGTTGRGIGPCYEDKYGRRGIRIEDIVSSSGKIRKDHFAGKVREVIGWYEEHGFIDAKGEASLKADEIVEQYIDFVGHFKDCVTDTGRLLYEADKRRKRILFEGAQGIMLDTDKGTYPHVTSSHPTVGGIGIGTGIVPELGTVIGVVKAYTTRVGEGPFPTEQDNEIGNYMRDKGGEYGTTTGRPRRCGWLDLELVEIAKRVNGLTEIAMTKLDVLSGLPEREMNICVRYDSDENPIYLPMDGWREDITEVEHFTQLPNSARRYIGTIEGLTQLQIPIISVGPGSKQQIVREFDYEYE